MLSIALAQAAFATPLAKTGSSHVERHKVTICHNGHAITVSKNALRSGHQIAAESSATAEGTDAVRGHKNHVDTLLKGDAGLTQGPQGACSSEKTEQQQQQQRQEPSEETSQEEDQPELPQRETTTTIPQEGLEEEQAKEAANNTEKVETCDGKSIELKAEEKRILELHNEARKKRRLEVLCIDPALTNAARAHSKDMAENNYFGHNSRNGETSGERLRRHGYNWRASGENVAWGSGSWAEAESRFKAWMDSPAHRRNILKAAYKEVGVGVETAEAKKGAANERTFYTVDFGTKKRR